MEFKVKVKDSEINVASSCLGIVSKFMLCYVCYVFFI